MFCSQKCLHLPPPQIAQPHWTPPCSRPWGCRWLLGLQLGSHSHCHELLRFRCVAHRLPIVIQRAAMQHEPRQSLGRGHTPRESLLHHPRPSQPVSRSIVIRLLQNQIGNWARPRLGRWVSYRSPLRPAIAVLHTPWRLPTPCRTLSKSRAAADRRHLIKNASRSFLGAFARATSSSLSSKLMSSYQHCTALQRKHGPGWPPDLAIINSNLVMHRDRGLEFLRRERQTSRHRGPPCPS